MEPSDLDAPPFPPTISRIPTISKCPQITQIDPDEFVFCCSVRRGPGRAMTAGHRWVGTPNRMQAFVRVSRPNVLRSASAASPLLVLTQKLDRERTRGRTDVPRARRPVRGPTATDSCIRSRRDSHRRQANPESPVVLLPRSGTTFQDQRPLLGVLVSWWLRRGRADLRLSA